MQLFKTVAGLRCYLDADRHATTTPDSAITPLSGLSGIPLEIGLVPTMGALHPGHLSLMERARRENKLVVVSIFVNPLQFGPQEDLARYPRTLEADLSLCQSMGVDVVFAPSPQTLGLGTNPGTDGLRPTEGHRALTQVVPPEWVSSGLCGRSRPGHFQGVATIVTKLFQIVQPHRAYFGQKDAQQVAVIQALVADLNLPVEVVACPIVREADGLAMSSRNQYLSTEARSQATGLFRGLKRAQELFAAGECRAHVLIDQVRAELSAIPTIAPEYIEIVHPTTMQSLEQIDETALLAVAARLETTRLIDNILLVRRKPIVAIDGPAGAGKSTVARQVAQTLGLLYLDTGAMYRAVTWLVLQSGMALTDEPAIAELVSQCEIQLGGEPTAVTVQIDGRDVTQVIRNLDVTAHVSTIAAQPIVRQELVKQQRRYGTKGGLVIEGRDIGTFVFPDAELKIFLTASVQERARRRQLDLIQQGKGALDLLELEQTIAERDHKDSTRLLAPLRKASDAIEVWTDGMTIPQVIDRIVGLYQERSGD